MHFDPKAQRVIDKPAAYPTYEDDGKNHAAHELTGLR
jgi:hypothetical protein